MVSPMSSEESGSVECPYCGHRVASNVKYTGQKMKCQNCTSELLAPTYHPVVVGYWGCLFGILFVCFIVFGLYVLNRL